MVSEHNNTFTCPFNILSERLNRHKDIQIWLQRTVWKLQKLVFNHFNGMKKPKQLPSGLSYSTLRSVLQRWCSIYLFMYVQTSRHSIGSGLFETEGGVQKTGSTILITFQLPQLVLSIYTVSQKKQDTKLLPITSPNVNRFSQFFHW